MRTLSAVTQQNILSLLRQGKTINQVADQCGVGKATVHRLYKKHLPNLFLSSGSRPAKLSSQNKRFCTRAITSGRVETATAVVKKLRDELNVEVSDRTIRLLFKRPALGRWRKRRSRSFRPKISKRDSSSQDGTRIGRTKTGSELSGQMSQK